MYGETDYLLKMTRYLVVEKNNVLSLGIQLYELNALSLAIFLYSTEPLAEKEKNL
jgi:hypothetical protein